MSGYSDSDEYFDAEEQESSETKPCVGTKMNPTAHEVKSTNTDDKQTVYSKQVDFNNAQLETDHPKKQERDLFRKVRERMRTEEEDGAVSNTSPADSQVSSMEDVFAGRSNNRLHPFRIIEHDTLSIQSITSLGRVGRILSGTSDSNAGETMKDDTQSISKSADIIPSHYARNKPVLKRDSRSLSEESVKTFSSSGTGPLSIMSPLQEPDVIASTKSSNNNTLIRNESKTVISENIPVAPPRRKKKAKRTSIPPISVPPLTTTTSTLYDFPASSTDTNCILPVYNAETTIIEDLTRELEDSLDIKLHSKGQYIVKPQDEDKTRGGRQRQNFEEKSSERKTEEIERNNRIIYETNRRVGCNTFPLKLTAHHTVTNIARNSRTYPLASASNHSMTSTRAGGLKYYVSPEKVNRQRRKSTGDEQISPPQLNMFIRTITDSGKQLTDMEILEQVPVLNLDTGEKLTLSEAEDKLPQGINPLSLHIMRLTAEYVSNSNLHKRKESDEESVDSKKSLPRANEDYDRDSVTLIKRKAKFKQFLDYTVRKTVSRAKIIAQEVSHVRHKDEITDIKDEVSAQQQSEPFKLRASNNHKGPYEFQSLEYVQELSGEHAGPVWCMKFSMCGRLLATAGRDRILRIWVLRNAYTYFQEMRMKYNAEKVSPTPSQESLVSQQSSCEDPSYGSADGAYSDDNSPFMPKPFCTYTGHTSDLLDLAWSKNYFVLSSSMDKTVRLWHISRKECLCCFQHIDFVTAICFHPIDDRYFLSGSLDGKLRLWNIPDKKVAVWNEVDGPTKLITAANFCQNGNFAVVGSYDGRCIFYNTDQLRYHTQIHVRSSRGKNARGRKITGIEPMPGETKILITSNDSRIRLYDLRDLNLSCKYKGYANVSSQIKASFSHDGKFIICGSENQCIYLWKTHHDYSKFPSVRRDRNDFWEGIKAHNAVVTCAVFAPNPGSIFQQIDENKKKDKDCDSQSEDNMLMSKRDQPSTGYVIVSGDFNGCIRVFLNRVKPKHSSLPASAVA